jgi:hypothetical protein
MKVITNYWDKIERFPDVKVTESTELRNSISEDVSRPAYNFICEVFKRFQLNNIECVLEGLTPTININHTFESENAKHYIQATISSFIPGSTPFKVNFNFEVKENTNG